jgi:penicillin-binding protein 1A
MKRSTGGGLPARIFKTFMEDAERGLPARPLIGTTLFAAEEDVPPQPPVVEESPSPPVVPAKAPNESEVLSAFQDLLDKLF